MSPLSVEYRSALRHDGRTRATSVMTSGGVHYYLTRLKLAPHETRAIDLGQLEDYQRPDFKGKKIPSGATDGSVNWIRLGDVPVSGRVAVIQKQTGTASSYDCFSCNCGLVFTGITALSPSTFSIAPQGFIQIAANSEYRDCNGLYYWYDETNLSSWSSSNSSFASVNSTGGITGVAVGSVSVSASSFHCGSYPPWYQGGGCTCTTWISGAGSATCHVNYGCDDDRDYIIQQYHEYTTSDTSPFYPVCTDFTNNASTTNFSFAELNKHQQYAWAILLGYFLTDLQATRNTYGSSMTVNSGYREPAYNHNLNPPGARDSQHLHGDAADIASDQST